MIIGISFYSVWWWLTSTTTWLLSIQWITFSFCFITFQMCITASDFCDFPCSFQYTKKTNFVFERGWEDGRVQIHLQRSSLFLVWSIVMAWCACVSGNHEHYHIAWNKMTFMKQYLWWSVLSVKDGNNQKCNNVYFKMHFWLILKDKSEKIHDYSTV